MHYRAKPVIVEAFQITGTEDMADGTLRLTLETGKALYPDKVILARYIPTVGDYWVIQEDGYTYVNSRDVFERKYEPVELFTPDRRPTDPQR